MGVVLDPVLSGKRGITMFHLTVPLNVSMVLHLPNTPYDAKMERVWSAISRNFKYKNTRVRTMQEQWNKFATSIHPEFEIFVELMFY